MPDDPTTDEPTTPQTEQAEQAEQAVYRSASGAAMQFLNDAKQGAGWTTGALAVTGVVVKGKELLGKGKKPEK